MNTGIFFNISFMLFLSFSAPKLLGQTMLPDIKKDLVKNFRIKQIVYSDNQSTKKCKYNSDGNLISYVNKDKKGFKEIQNFTYDDKGKISKKSAFTESNFEPIWSEIWTFDEVGNNTSYVKFNKDGEREYHTSDNYLYDHKNRVLRHVSYNNNFREDSIVYVYHDNQRQMELSEYDHTNRRKWYVLTTYDTIGREITIKRDFYDTENYDVETHRYNKYAEEIEYSKMNHLSNEENYSVTKSLFEYQDSLPVRQVDYRYTLSPKFDTLTKNQYVRKIMDYTDDNKILSVKTFNFSNELEREENYSYDSKYNLIKYVSKNTKVDDRYIKYNENFTKNSEYFDNGTLKQTREYRGNNENKTLYNNEGVLLSVSNANHVENIYNATVFYEIPPNYSRKDSLNKDLYDQPFSFQDNAKFTFYYFNSETPKIQISEISPQGFLKKYMFYDNGILSELDEYFYWYDSKGIIKKVIQKENNQIVNVVKFKIRYY